MSKHHVKYLLVGGGLAAGSAAEAIRARDAGGSILLVPYREKLVGIGVDEVRDLQSVRADGVQGHGGKMRQ